MKIILTIAVVLMTAVLSAQTTKEIIDSPRTDKMIFVDTTQKVGKSIARLDDVEGGEFIFSLTEEDRRGKTHIGTRKYEIWVQSYNPLSYTFGNTVELVTDRNAKTIADFLNSISEGSIESDGDNVGKLLLNLGENLIKLSSTTETGQEKNDSVEKCNCNIADSIYAKIDSLGQILKMNPARYGDTILQLLIDLPFYEKKSTEAELIKFKGDLSKLEKTYASYDELCSFAQKLIEEKIAIYSSSEYCWTQLQVMRTNIIELQETSKQQQKSISNASKVLGFVNDFMDENQKNFGVHEGKWCFKITGGSVTRKEQANEVVLLTKYKVTIDEEGNFKRDQIGDPKELKLTVIWHRTFIPEVGTGMFYSFIESPDFEMGTNGEIVQIGQNNFEKVTISAMANFNANIRGWHVLPFWQVGFGVRSDLPIGMLGGGVRFGLMERTVAISGGISITGVQGLNSLNLGDQVTDDARIQEDISYKFGVPAGYFGIQIDL